MSEPEGPSREQAPAQVAAEDPVEESNLAVQAEDVAQVSSAPPRDSTGPDSDSPGFKLSESVAQVLGARAADPPFAAGTLVTDILSTHPYYLGSRPGTTTFTEVGDARTAADHAEAAFSVWDETRTPLITARHVLLGLALTDPELGWQLLQSGTIAAISSEWQPGLGTEEEPKRVVWDIMNATWRRRAVDTPLLAAALGAPPDQVIEAADEVTALVFAPNSDELAVLVGDRVCRASVEVGGPVTPTGERIADATALGWGPEGLVALTSRNRAAEIREVATGTVLGTVDDAPNALLSGDGSQVWLKRSTGLWRWMLSGSDLEVGPAADVLSLSADGQSALVHWQGTAMVVGPASPGPLVDPSLGDPASSSETLASPVPTPTWPSTATTVISTVGGYDVLGGRACLVARGRWFGVAVVESSGSIRLMNGTGTVMARLAVGGATPISAIGADATGSMIAVAQGARVSLWRISRRRPTNSAVAGFDADLASGTDLLGADQRARALAALIASSALVPPLSIGLFGDWGSGKSFLLDLIERRIRELTSPTGPRGYLRNVKIVKFNAWRYVESNLWASLVDHVLREITSANPPLEPQRLTEARREMETREAAERQSAVRLEEAKQSFTKQRRRAWLLATVVLGLALAVLGVTLAVPGDLHDKLGWISARVVAVVGLVAALVGALHQFKATVEKAEEIEKAAQSGVGTLGMIVGRPQQRALEAAAAEHRKQVDLYQQGRARYESLSGTTSQEEPDEETAGLAMLLNQLAGVTEFREQLTLVSHAHDLFQALDQRVQKTLTALRSQAAEPPLAASVDSSKTSLERVVVIIDDLDRCPPTKVVDVLEAIHLMFDFQTFVVVLAVDTRWLEQSLRIRHRELLGAEHTATPQDYLEKVVQVPVQLSPLNPTNVRAMIAGLTATSASPGSEASTPDDDGLGVDSPPSPPSSVPDEVLTAVEPRPKVGPVPAEVLSILPHEAAALAAVAPLVGRTPRTVKRFVNTYKIVKASLVDPSEVSQPSEPPGPAKLIAFLLALVTSRPDIAHLLFAHLDRSLATGTLQTSITASGPTEDPDGTRLGRLELSAWLTRNPDIANVTNKEAHRWAGEVARFSFTRIVDSP
ncbi:MAG: P-loop NTPase fold protein [Actinomycetota bacterium]|nr:P-loop NTPase fold protein [Actinomycetota bacterium]